MGIWLSFSGGGEEGWLLVGWNGMTTYFSSRFNRTVKKQARAKTLQGFMIRPGTYELRRKSEEDVELLNRSSIIVNNCIALLCDSLIKIR